MKMENNLNEPKISDAEDLNKDQQVTENIEKDKNKFKFFLFGLLLATLIFSMSFFIYLYYFQNSSNTNIEEQTIINTEEKQTSKDELKEDMNIEFIDTENWILLRNKEYGFKFSYPSDWEKSKKGYSNIEYNNFYNSKINLKKPSLNIYEIVGNNLYFSIFHTEKEFNDFLCRDNKDNCQDNLLNNFATRKIEDEVFYANILHFPSHGPLYPNSNVNLLAHYIKNKDKFFVFMTAVDVDEPYKKLEIYYSAINSFDFIEENSEKISISIKLENEQGEPLTNFPLRIESPGGLKSELVGLEINVINSNENGIVEAKVYPGSLYLEPGNKDWYIDSDFCEDLFSYDCRFDYENFLNDEEYKKRTYGGDLCDTSQSITCFRELTSGHRIYNDYEKNENKIILKTKPKDSYLYQENYYFDTELFYSDRLKNIENPENLFRVDYYKNTTYNTFFAPKIHDTKLIKVGRGSLWYKDWKYGNNNSTTIIKTNNEIVNYNISDGYISWEEIENKKLKGRTVKLRKGVFLYDLSSKEKQEIKLENIDATTEPFLNNDKLVFRDLSDEKTNFFGDEISNSGNIYLYDLTTKELNKITEQGGCKMPIVSNNYIAWINNKEINLYDIASATQKIITNDSHWKEELTISGKYVAWNDFGSGDQGYDHSTLGGIRIYDIETDKIIKIPLIKNSDSVPINKFHRFPALDDDKLYYEGGHDNFYRDLANSRRAGGIFVFDILKNETKMIFDRGRNVYASNDKVVWEATNLIKIKDFDYSLYYYNMK